MKKGSVETEAAAETPAKGYNRTAPGPTLPWTGSASQVAATVVHEPHRPMLAVFLLAVTGLSQVVELWVWPVSATKIDTSSLDDNWFFLARSPSRSCITHDRDRRSRSWRCR